MKPPFRLLQLGTYPIKLPQHGGQRRVAALRDAYRAAGIEAEYVGIFNIHSYAHETATRQDIKVGPTTHARIAASPWLEDLFVGEALLYDDACREKFLRFWRKFRPDVVALEQPFVWASLRRLIADGVIDRPRKIIHSSQNVESEMKAGIYARVLPPVQRAAAVEKVREVEDDLTRQCDVLVAVHRTDAERLLRAANKPCLLLRNGGEVRTPSARALKKWTKKLRESPPRRAFFVGSTHLPNGQGFEQMLGPALGYLPPDCEIVVAGGVCELLQESKLCTGPMAGVNGPRLRLLDRLPDDDLAAVIALSRVVLLPITSGGGSNLKTVEALLSGKPVVGTSYAFRAYEDFADCGTVTLTDEPAAFKRAVVERLWTDETDPARSAAWEQRLQQLTWASLGRIFVQELLAVLAGEIRQRPRAA